MQQAIYHALCYTILLYITSSKQTVTPSLMQLQTKLTQLPHVFFPMKGQGIQIVQRSRLCSPIAVRACPFMSNFEVLCLKFGAVASGDLLNCNCCGNIFTDFTVDKKTTIQMSALKERIFYVYDQDFQKCNFCLIFTTIKNPQLFAISSSLSVQKHV